MNKDIIDAIRLLSKHNFRTTSSVTGEYIEKLIAGQYKGELAKYCQSGFDLFSKELGKVEVKSRNAESGSLTCYLNKKKLDTLDNFIVVVVQDGIVEDAWLFDSKSLLALYKPGAKTLSITKKRFKYGKNITQQIKLAF